MYPITTETATQDHEFTDGDESQLIPPTDFNALWCNTIQRELLNVLAGAGITPSASVFNQVWQSIVSVGIKNIYSTDSTVDVSSFVGATVIFHSASNFAISGTINKYSLLIIVPTWSSNSSEYINFTYGGATTKIYKDCIFVGFAMNESVLKIYGVSVPIADANNVMSLKGVTAATLKYLKNVDNGIVSFAYNENDEGLADWQEWQLASNWSLNQVKKVYCTNAVASGTPIVVYYDDTHFRDVMFYQGGYREFVCVGTKQSGDYTFAILRVNGKA